MHVEDMAWKTIEEMMSNGADIESVVRKAVAFVNEGASLGRCIVRCVTCWMATTGFDASEEATYLREFESPAVWSAMSRFAFVANEQREKCTDAEAKRTYTKRLVEDMCSESRIIGLRDFIDPNHLWSRMNGTLPSAASALVSFWVFHAREVPDMPAELMRAQQEGRFPRTDAADTVAFWISRALMYARRNTLETVETELEAMVSGKATTHTGASLLRFIPKALPQYVWLPTRFAEVHESLDWLLGDFVPRMIRRASEHRLELHHNNMHKLLEWALFTAARFKHGRALRTTLRLADVHGFCMGSGVTTSALASLFAPVSTLSGVVMPCKPCSYARCLDLLRSRGAQWDDHIQNMIVHELRSMALIALPKDTSIMGLCAYLVRHLTCPLARRRLCAFAMDLDVPHKVLDKWCRRWGMSNVAYHHLLCTKAMIVRAMPEDCGREMTKDAPGPAAEIMEAWDAMDEHRLWQLSNEYGSYYLSEVWKKALGWHSAVSEALTSGYLSPDTVWCQEADGSLRSLPAGAGFRRAQERFERQGAATPP